MSTHAAYGSAASNAASPSAAATPARERPGEGAARRRLAALGALLLTGTAVPAAVLTVPDASANVVPAAADALGRGGAGVAGLRRATGLSLPALLLAVPPAAAAARRFPAWTVLAAGLAVLLAGLGAARLADSVLLTGAVRAVQGAGAGTVLPASLVLVWERRDYVLAAAWAGVLAGTLIAAMPLALAAVPAGGAPVPDWRVALAPFPWLAVAAAGAAAARPLLRGRVPWTLPPARHTERGRLLVPLVPAAGFAFLAVVAADGWSPGARLLVGGLAVPALLGLAAVGGRDAQTGSPHGCALAMVAVGLLGYPVAGPLAGLAATARGPGGAPLLPFAAAAVAALAGALAATRAPARGAVRTGLLLLASAPPLGLAADPRDRWTLLAMLVPLGAGAGLALAGSLRDAAPGAALFGLTLCFPAVLTGQLIVLSLQASRLRGRLPVTETQQVQALLEGYRGWLAAAGMLAAVLAAAAVRPGLRRRNATSGARGG